MKTVKEKLEEIKEIYTISNVWNVEFNNIPKCYKEEIPGDLIIVAKNNIGDFLLIQKEKLLSSNTEIYVFWHEGSYIEVIIEDFNEYLNSLKKNTDLPIIKYYSGEQVLLNDFVYIKKLFFKKRGKVFYVPGISKKNPEFEYGGLLWVGIKFKSGYTGTIVDPLNYNLKKNVVFLSHTD